jgi:predicted permease
MRFYRLLLLLYPASFRREYGADMIADFARRRRESSWALLDSAFDVLKNAAGAHWDVLRQDLRYAARTLAHSPGFAITAILVTAIGIGANTAAFTVADFVLLRPLPFADPQSLVRMCEGPLDGTGWGCMNELSPANYRDYKAMSHSFSVMGAFTGGGGNLVGGAEPQRVASTQMTPEVFPLLGVAPLIGRTFDSTNGGQGDRQTVVLSFGLWQSRFGGDLQVLGRTVSLDGRPYEVIGVMPPTFNFPARDVQLWTPLLFGPDDYQDRTNSYLQAIGRIKPGVTMDHARADLSVVIARLGADFPATNAETGFSLFWERNDMAPRFRTMLLALCGASLCILLLACANLANLLLARAAARERELMVRSALGAGRERLVRQMVTESVVLAVLGGVCGVVVAIVTVPLLGALVPRSLPLAELPAVNVRVLLFAALLAAATGIGFGVYPAWRAVRTTDLGALRTGSRSGGGGRARVRAGLVIAEVMASVVLLVTTGLLLRALWRVQSVDTGFDTQNVITMRTALPWPRYAVVAGRQRFFSQVLNEVRALPGVSSAAYISGVPLEMYGGIWGVTRPGIPRQPGEDNWASLRYITPSYFATLGIRLLRGRDIAETDRIDQKPWAAVVSQSLVDRYFPGQDGLGKQIIFVDSVRTIVGVVANVRVRGLETPSEPQVYLSYQQVPDSAVVGYTPKDLVMRTTAPLAAVLPRVQAIVRSVDPDQPISHVRMLEEVVEQRTAVRATQARMLAALAIIAFVLACVGIHGLLSYAVATRRHEIGVRMALGAGSMTIVRMVMRQAVVLAAAGVLPGIVLAFVAGRALQSLLAGVQPGDAVTFATAVTLCVVMTLAGSLLPVLRAVQVEPATAFRSE